MMVYTTYGDYAPLLAFSFVALLLLAVASPSASAAKLGVNYYHESMVSQQWGVPYIPRTTAQVGQDLDHIGTISGHIKLYMNPFVDANLPWIQTIAALAEQRGFYTVVNMMVDDRQLSDANWNAYADRVASACAALNGKVDSILVGNEITLHSPWTDSAIKTKVVQLMDRCDASFNGQVSYEEFWYAKEVWYGYTQRPIYFMMYENLASFQTNMQELNSRFGANAIVGEWGEDSLDEGVDRGDWWQREQIILRWDIIRATSTPVAYIFTYREPNWNAFGIIRPDGLDRPVWSFLDSIGDGLGSQPPACVPSTEVCDGRDNDCDGQSDEGGVCSVPPPPSGGWTIGSLALSCTVNGQGCSVLSDATSGTCRTVTWNSPAGQVRVQGCDKGDGWVELYKLSYPSGSTMSACFANGCVTHANGFARFQPVVTPPPACVPSTEVCDGRDNDCDGQSDEGGVCSTPPPPSGGWTIATLVKSCTGTSCSVVSDATSGSCRTIRWNAPGGEIRIQGCDKGSGWVEIYKQAAPSGLDFSACLDSGCVSKGVGFVRFQPSGGGTPPPPTGTTLATLPFSSNPSGSKSLDVIEGTCRRVQYDTGAGSAQAKACDKNGGNYELYFLSGSSSVAICVQSACVGGGGSGFATFTA